MPRSSSFVRRARTPVAAGPAVLAALTTLVASADSSAAATPRRPQGIDVSRWQSAAANDACAVKGIDWAKVPTSSRSLVVRATHTTHGRTLRDACYSRNFSGARARGIYRGAYHYAVPSAQAGSAARDARAFVAVAGHLQGAGDLPPVLDLETSGGLKPAQLVA